MSKEEKFKKTLQQLLDQQQFAFTESDWEAAKKVLDDKRKKRRLLPLWFTLTGLVIFTGTMLLWPEAKPVDQQKDKHSEQNLLAPISKLEPIAEQNNLTKPTQQAPALIPSNVLAISRNTKQRKLSMQIHLTTSCERKS